MWCIHCQLEALNSQPISDLQRLHIRILAKYTSYARYCLYASSIMSASVEIEICLSDVGKTRQSKRIDL